MKNSAAVSFVALALAAVVAAVGCSGNGGQLATTSGGTPTPFPTPSVACTPPSGYQIQEVFPQNGVTGVANLQGVVFAVYPNPLPTNWYFYATSVNGSTAFTNSIGFLATPVPVPGSTAGATPTPLPTPSDTPALPAGYVYETASLGIFAKDTGFSIFLANSNCYPGLPESTFTTAPYDSPSASPTPSPTATAT